MKTNMFGAHLSHRFIADDDVLECAYCQVRIYNEEAKAPCPENQTTK